MGRPPKCTLPPAMVAMVMVIGWASPGNASGYGDWSEVGPSFARVGGFILPALTLRGDDDGRHAGLLWEVPLVFTSCDPSWCRRSGSDLGPRSNTQWSTTPAILWYPGIGTVATRLTERFWLFQDDWDWNPAISLGLGWFSFGRDHGPTAELRLWLGPVMFGSTTRGRAVGFFAGANAERAIDDYELRFAYSVGIEAPIYVELDE